MPTETAETQPTDAPTPEPAPEPTATNATKPLRPAPTATDAGAAPIPSGETATVIRVVDGDTIHVMLNGKDETLRYIGVDTPEEKKPNTPVQCFAVEAAAMNERLVAGQTLTLERDRSDRDRYGRLLRYVYLPDGRMVNEELVKAGAAFAKRYPPDTKHASLFDAAQSAAQSAGVGLWAACTVAGGQTNAVAGNTSRATSAPGAGSGAPAASGAGACPADRPIKGNRGKKEWVYHMPGQSAYEKTIPEECFATAADAEAAGYRAAKR